jgi:hypothetical protein
MIQLPLQFADPQKPLGNLGFWTLVGRWRRNWMSRTQRAFNSSDLAFQEIIMLRPYRDSDRPIAPLLPVSPQPAVCPH